MILVTGSKGFIGSHLMRALPTAIGVDKGDDLDSFLKVSNLDAIYHMGAISDTTCTDKKALEETNVRLTLQLAEIAAWKRIPFIYASSASVYGNGQGPLNDYALSKLTADEMMAERFPHSMWFGMRFFNVYGSGEEHKGRQASLVHQMKHGLRRIFEPFARRDFVHVSDCVRVMLWFQLFQRKAPSGCYDVGTGRPTLIADLARAVRGDDFEIVSMPASLRGKYQFHTKADLTKLREAGYDRPFLSLSEGLLHDA